jgi:sugar lactone lactonase YvrE
VIQLDPRTGAQRVYANLRDVPACRGAGQSDCSMTSTDNAPSPDFAAFGPDGSLYVTDFQQGLIWKIDRDGGDANHVHVWFTSPLLDGVLFGPAGIQLTDDGRALVFSVFSALGAPEASDPATGKLYTLNVGSDGRPTGLRRLWESRPGDAPDGFAIARSGHIYVALGGPGANQLAEINASGAELARVPLTPLDNAEMPVPFDEPSGVTFDGERLLVTNLSYIAGDPTHWVIFDVFAGESGLALVRPRISSIGTAR